MPAAPWGAVGAVVAAATAVDWSKLAERPLCDSCLGRLVGKVGHGHTNGERGRSVRDVAEIRIGPCWICDGLTARYDGLAVLVAHKLEPWEFDTFRIGSKVDPEIAAREESLWTQLGLAGPEPLKAEVNREVGKRVSERIRKEPDVARPDIVGILDTLFDHVDPRMLGRGRPFILEVKEPRRRRFDTVAAVERINASGTVEVDGLVPSDGGAVVALKEDRAAKSYRVVVRTTPIVPEAKLKGALLVLVPEPIAQRTPGRVVHRRADTTRARRLLAAEVVGVEGDRAEIRVTAEAGTYIKEWVHGDGGRTRPSLSERLGAACEVLELDVLGIHDGGGGDGQGLEGDHGEDAAEVSPPPPRSRALSHKPVVSNVH